MNGHVRFAPAAWMVRAAARLTRPARYCVFPVPVS